MLDFNKYRDIVRQIESSGGKDTLNEESGAFGDYQFIPKTAAEYGLKPGDNQEGAFKSFTDSNRKVLVAELGREPTMGELYLAHQQGATGALELLTNPDAPAVAIRPEKAITLNGGDPDMTAGEFTQQWTNKFDMEPTQGTPNDMAGMQPVEVEGETIYFPADMSDDDISAALQANLAPQKPDNHNGLGAMVAGAADSASMGFGDEIGAAIGAGVAAPFSDRGFSEIYKDALAENRAGDAEIKAEHPNYYMGGQVAGAVVPAVGTGAALATRAPKLYSLLAGGKGLARKGITGGAVGSVSGATYGFGSGTESPEKRLEEASTGAIVGGVAGPAGLVAGRGISKLAKGGVSLAERALRAFGGAADNAVAATDDIAAKQLQGIADKGSLLPMTKGQITQDAEAQSLENMARANTLGTGAANDIKAFDSSQQTAIRDVLGGMGANADEATTLSGVGRTLQQAYKGGKAQVGKAYDDASTANARVSGDAIRESFAPRIKSMMQEGGFDLTDMTPRAQKLITQASELDPRITEMSLKNMEFWRRKASNAMNDSKDGFGKLNSEGVALKKMVDEYDRFMAKLPEDALKAGDEAALDAINKARGSRRELGVLFERDKAIERIVKTSDLTDEELANMVLTGSKASEKLGTGSGRLVKNIKRAAGEKSAEVTQGLKSGAMARIMRKATGTIQEAGTERNVIQPAKLRNELDALLKNRSFVKEVFSPQEATILKQLRDDVAKIVSEQKGTNNYSNTAYTLAQFFRRLPLNMERPVEWIGERGARKDLGIQLQQFADETQRALVGKAKYYGAALPAAPLTDSAGSEDAPTQIMVNPNGKNPYQPPAN